MISQDAWRSGMSTGPVTDPRREPALWIALAVTVVQLAVSFIPGLSSPLQGLINAVAVAAAGFAVSALVKREGQVPAAVGLVQALIALLVGMGLDVTSTQQALILAVANAVGALFVRTQVQAKIDEFGRPRPSGG